MKRRETLLRVSVGALVAGSAIYILMAIAHLIWWDPNIGPRLAAAAIEEADKVAAVERLHAIIKYLTIAVAGIVAIQFVQLLRNQWREVRGRTANPID